MIPVIINNRDLLTWPKEMVERIKRYDGVGDIIILDNGSTYEPLLEWYETKPCKIIKLGENQGHAAPWTSGTVANLGVTNYIVTDPDMGLLDTPDDTLLYLQDKLKTFPVGKIGLGLLWEHIGPESMYYNHLQSYEKNRWESSLEVLNLHVEIKVDTTFALYQRPEYFIGGFSTGGDYRARHYPWEFTKDSYEKDEEFKQYIHKASNSSSFKWFLNL